MKNQRKKVGLALGSGGARGLAHIGVIKVLEKNQIPIDYIAGTSMGALVAAYYALFMGVAELEKHILSYKKADFLRLVDLNNPKISLIKGEKIRKLLESYFGVHKFKDTKIPLRIGATNLEDGSRVVFKSGRIVNALMASASVPGIFPPVNYHGKPLVDGGLADATPIDLVKEFDPDVIIGVDLFTLNPSKKTKYNSLDVLYRSYDILMSNLVRYKIQNIAENILILKPKAGKRTETFAFHKAKEKIKAGEECANKNIKIIRKLVR